MNEQLQQLVSKKVDAIVIGKGFQVCIDGKLVFHRKTGTFSVGQLFGNNLTFTPEAVKSISFENENLPMIVIKA
jgi:hypothetical protein